MRIFKKILGALLLLIVAGLVLGPIIIQYGWLAALITLVVALLVTGLLVGGVWLIVE